MFRVYITIIIMLILGSVAYGAKYYYDTTQETISVLRTNNATLETSTSPAGEILFSTRNFNNGDSYTIIVEVR